MYVDKRKIHRELPRHLGKRKIHRELPRHLGQMVWIWTKDKDP